MIDNMVYRDECREEVINGEVVMMSPALSNHNRITRNLARIFDTYLRGKECEYFPDGEALYFSEQEEYIPDGMIVCDPSKVNYKGVFGAPDLVIEVLSRATAKYDRGHKKDTYARYGVREYWIIDPVRKSVEQYFLKERTFVLQNVLGSEDCTRDAVDFKCSLYDDLTISLEDVFSRVP